MSKSGLKGQIVEKMPEAIIAAYLTESGQTISVAESCTGGRIASRLTSLAGSSRYFESGCVTYSNASKTRLVGVSAELIELKGAVSRVLASAMAEGIRHREGVDFGLAVTGIAGPEGGSVGKPIGLVYIAVADERQTHVLECRFDGDRETIQSAATSKALEFLVERLKEKL